MNARPAPCSRLTPPERHVVETIENNIRILEALAFGLRPATLAVQQALHDSRMARLILRRKS